MGGEKEANTGKSARINESRRLGKALAVLVAGFLSLRAGIAGADCIIDIWSNAVAPFTNYQVLFPNWVDVPAASFTIYEGDDLTYPGCTDSSIVGVTILNYGTATGGGGGDITGMAFQVKCGSKTDTVLYDMTYAGPWGGRAAWTWAGTIAFGGNPCDGPGFNCSCSVSLNVYADIGPCPTDGATVELGPGFNDIVSPTWPGGVVDSCGCAGPWSEVRFDTKFIRYVSKIADLDVAAPGDTVNYTIYYGRPGSVALTSITVWDTMPEYTHLLPGTDSPAADPGFDPDPGPPMHLRWTRPGGATGGGPTDMVTFALTIDWGNTESFEPGSGDIAAPEGMFLANRAQLSWDPGTSCPSGRLSGIPTTSVRRFLFWKVADNDVLYSNTYGQPPDEITYSISMKNVSLSKTWWNIVVWDTVPAQLEPFGPNCGFEDPCAGWTMTPTGCAAAAPGWIATASKTTLLTWHLDMPPQFTLELRWKAQVRTTANSGDFARGPASILSLGKTMVIDGTGHSVTPRKFMHEAAIILPTMYTSYIGLAAANINWWGCCNTGPMATQSYWLAFFPLNKKADFNLYEQLHAGDAFQTGGGASPPINGYVGGCMTGGASWIAGCKVEKAPAHYIPVAFAACPGPPNIHYLYKLVSNSPLLWELLTANLLKDADASTYAGTTSLTYNGYTSYTFCRVCEYPLTTDGLYIVNTTAANPTTVHVFRWDSTIMNYVYRSTSDINKESMWYFNPDAAEGYKIISSDSPLIIFKGYPGIGAGGAFNDSGAQAPNRENGYLVSTTVPASFYAFAGGPANDGVSLLVGGMGGGTSTYVIWKYMADNPLLPNPSTTHLTSLLLGNSGSWVKTSTDTVTGPITDPANPHVYGAGYDGLISATYDMYKVELTAGGPISVYNGRDVFSGYGCGSVIHAKTPPLGSEYWFHMGSAANSCNGTDQDIMTLDFYIPKAGTMVRAVSSDGYSAAYTTPGQDSCVSFKSLTTPANPGTRIWRVNSFGGNVAVAHQIHCQLAEKIYTAPFLFLGVHYSIIVPPVAYIGESFWITVVVIEADGTTKTDYTGTTSFTSTDPLAKVETQPMENYNYTWIPSNAGVKMFFNVTFTKMGLQSIVALDTVDGSITGLATIMVVGVDVRFWKEPRMSIAASGDTVNFRICWSNYSSASALSFVMTDSVPFGTTYVPQVASNHICGTTSAIAYDFAYATAPSTSPPASGWVTTTGTPLTNTYWLRWTIKAVGIDSTGCACFKVLVN